MKRDVLAGVTAFVVTFSLATVALLAFAWWVGRL